MQARTRTVGTQRGGARPCPRPARRRSPNSDLLLLRRTSHLHHAAHVHLGVARRNLEEARIWLTFLDVGQCPGRILRHGLDGEMYFLVNPDIGYTAVLIGDLPVIAGAAVYLFDTNLLARRPLFVSAGITGIAQRFDVGRHARPVARHFALLRFHVHVLLGHQHVANLGLKVDDHDGAAARTTLHVHTHMTATKIHLARHVPGGAAAARGAELHIGRERLGLHGGLCDRYLR